MMIPGSQVITPSPNKSHRMICVATIKLVSPLNRRAVSQNPKRTKRISAVGAISSHKAPLVRGLIVLINFAILTPYNYVSIVTKKSPKQMSDSFTKPSYLSAVSFFALFAATFFALLASCCLRASAAAARFLNRSTRPSVSIIFSSPVKNG